MYGTPLEHGAPVWCSIIFPNPATTSGGDPATVCLPRPDRTPPSRPPDASDQQPHASASRSRSASQRLPNPLQPPAVDDDPGESSTPTTPSSHPATIFHFRPNPKSDGLKPITPPPPLAPTDPVDGGVPLADDSHPRPSAAHDPSAPCPIQQPDRHHAVDAHEEDKGKLATVEPTIDGPPSLQSEPFIMTATASSFQIRQGRKPTLITVATRGESSSPVINNITFIPLRSHHSNPSRCPSSHLQPPHMSQQMPASIAPATPDPGWPTFIHQIQILRPAMPDAHDPCDASSYSAISHPADQQPNFYSHPLKLCMNSSNSATIKGGIRGEERTRRERAEDLGESGGRTAREEEWRSLIQ
ncbi:hypothetical protein ACLOJK_016067 [Asimina triloba]